MNKKLTRGALAGVAVVALAAGGGTFAAWSDFDAIEGNAVKADTFELVMNKEASATFTESAMRPGEASERTVVLASRTGKATVANLSMTVAELVGTENGCSSDSEKAEDADCAGTNEGDFIDQARLIVNSYPAVNTQGGCDGKVTAVTGADGRTLSSLKNAKLSLLPATDDSSTPTKENKLEPGEQVCLAVMLYMPKGTAPGTPGFDNKAQGDSAKFDLDFLLEQDIDGSRI